ncbi:MAG: DinB family protein [Anaerolineales bacterium]
MTEILEEYRSQLLDRYRSQAEELRRALARFSVESLHRPLEPGGWSAHQVAVHVRDTEAKAFAPRVVRIVTENDPELPTFDGEGWMAAHYDRAEALDDILRDIERVRSEALARIAPLPAAGWSRSGRHPERGRRTVQWWVEYSVAHTQEHIEQISRG